MRCYFKYLLLVVAMGGTCGAALAQSPTYGLGKTPTQEEIKAMHTDPTNNGQGLPPGSGTADQGAKIFAARCAVCHGPTGKEGHPDPLPNEGHTVPPLVKSASRPMGVWRWPYAPNIWDFIHRAMPWSFPGVAKWTEGTLSPDDTYALTAWILYQNGIIKEGDVMNEKTLGEVRMPERDTHPMVNPVPDPSLLWNK